MARFRTHSDVAALGVAPQPGQVPASSYLFTDAFESEGLFSEEDDPGDDADFAEELLSALLACSGVDFRA